MTPQGAKLQIKAELVRSRYVSCNGIAAGLQARHRQADARLPGRWTSSSAYPALTATAIKAKPAASIIAALSPPSVSDQRRNASDTFIPLTKARKLAKPEPTDFPPSRLQQAGRAARYVLLAVGAGVTMKALAVDVTDAAITSAILAAGVCNSLQNITHTQLMSPCVTCAGKKLKAALVPWCMHLSATHQAAQALLCQASCLPYMHHAYADAYMAPGVESLVQAAAASCTSVCTC